MMADTRQMRKTIHDLQRVKTWQLVLVLILMLFVAATFLRINNVGMVQRLDAVVAADKTGNTDQTRSRLYDLQRYTIAHMNANTGTFELTEQYNRDSQKVYEALRVATSQSANARAEAVCHPQFSNWSGGAYMKCFLEEMAKIGPGVDPTKVKLPDSALYRYAFSSPLWSADFAGVSILVCIALMLIIAARGVGLLALKVLIKRHYREA